MCRPAAAQSVMRAASGDSSGPDRFTRKLLQASSRRSGEPACCVVIGPDSAAGTGAFEAPSDDAAGRGQP